MATFTDVIGIVKVDGGAGQFGIKDPDTGILGGAQDS